MHHMIALSKIPGSTSKAAYGSVSTTTIASLVAAPASGEAAATTSRARGHITSAETTGVVIHAGAASTHSSSGLASSAEMAAGNKIVTKF